MSVVSAKLDNVVMKNMRRRNFIAVQRSVPGSDVAYTLPPRKVDPSATARRLAKKCDYVPPAPAGVPLYSLQRGTDLVYASSPFYPTQKLKAPNPMPGYIDYERLVSDLFIPFDTTIDYAMGIRPGRRALKVQALPLEAPVPLFRPGK
jgi:hypothetical protein